MKEDTSEVVDLIGSTRLYTIHNYQKIIVYESGNFVVLWDTELDKKIKMHNHEYQIQALKFFGFENRYLISVDGYYKVSLYITQWETMKRVCQIYLPEKKRDKPVLSVVMGVGKKQDQIYIAENEQNGGYRFSIWTFYNEKLQMLFISETKTEFHCQQIESFYTDDEYQQVAVIENNSIKLWKIREETKEAIICNKVNLQEEIQALKIQEFNNYMFVITVCGKLYQLDQEGNFLKSKKGDSRFVCMDLWQNFIFLGCNKGTIQIYDIEHEEFINEIGIQNPSKYLYVEQIQENVLEVCQGDNETVTYQQKINNKKVDQMDLYSMSVEQLSVGDDGNVLGILYSDGRLALFDFQKNQCSQQQVGQYEKINSVLWISDDEFYSIGNEGNVFRWFRQKGEEGNEGGVQFRCKIIDVKKAVQNLSEKDIYQGTIFVESLKPQILEEKVRYKEKFKYKICSVAEHDGTIYLGDNLGNIIFMDGKLGQVFQVYKIAPYKIKKLEIFHNYRLEEQFYCRGLYCVIVFCTGLSVIVNLNNQCQVQQKLESHLDFESLKMKVYKDAITFYDNYQNVQESQFGFLVACTQNFNSVRVHSVQFEVYQREGVPVQLSAMPKCILYVEGLLKGFQIHPSNNYVLMLSSLGYIDIYKINYAHKVGRIEVPYFSSNLLIDPSGLYFCVSTPSQYTENLHRKSPQEYNIVKENSSVRAFNNTKSLCNRKLARNCNIQFYEFGEGSLIEQQTKLFGISSISFSPSGWYYVVGSHRGSMIVYETSYKIQQNIENVFSQLKIDIFMWDSYEIDLKHQIDRIERNKNEFEMLRICDKKAELELSDEQYQEYSRFIHKPNKNSSAYKQNEFVDRFENDQNEDYQEGHNFDLEYPLSKSIELSRVTGQKQKRWIREPGQVDNYNRSSQDRYYAQQSQKMKSILQNPDDYKKFQEQFYEQQPEAQYSQYNITNRNQQTKNQQISSFQQEQNNYQYIEDEDEDKQFLFDRSYVKKEMTNIPLNSITAQIDRSKKMKELIRQKNFQNVGKFDGGSKTVFGSQNIAEYQENKFDNNSYILAKNIDKQDFQNYYRSKHNLVQNQAQTTNQFNHRPTIEPNNIDDYILDKGEVEKQSFQEKQIQKCYDILLQKGSGTKRKTSNEYENYKPEPKDIDDDVAY